MDPKTGEIIEYDTKAALQEAMRRSQIIPVYCLPNYRCKKCHGRGWTGRDVDTGDVIPCKCTMSKTGDKNIWWDCVLEVGDNG